MQLRAQIRLAILGIICIGASALYIKRNDTLQSHATHTTIHLLTQGRSGSCFLGKLFQIQGLPYVFEPDNNNGWGLWQSSSTEIQHRINCLYTCDNCAAIVSNQKLYHTVCTASPEQVAIKTVGGLSDLAVLSSIPGPQIHNAKFLLMFRDPRAALNSVRKANWATGPPGCRLPLLQYLSAKEFAKSVSGHQVRAAFFEHWSQDVETFVPELFKWNGLDVSDAVRKKATSSKKASALEWTTAATSLFPGDIARITNAPYCQEYMQLVGYPLRPTRLEDFSALKDPFKTPMTAAEVALLAQVRRDQYSFVSTNRSGHYPLLLMNEPEPGSNLSGMSAW